MADLGAIKRKFRRPAMAASETRVRGAYGVALRDGIVCGLLIACLLAAWMALRADDTAWKVQSVLPSKSALLEEPTKPQAARTTQPGLADVQNIDALPPAPISGLVENFEGAQLPIARSTDDLTPFNAYKKPFKPVAGRPVVSFVIVDFGLSGAMSASILENMPGDVTFALSAYADEPTKWAAASRTYGHEFWVMLPMQTGGHGLDDNGPDTLLINALEQQNMARLFNVLGRSAGYAGVVSQPGHAFTQSAQNGDAILKQIFGRGLAFAESNPDMAAFGLPMAVQSGYPYVQNNFWLDQDLHPAAIDRTLAEFELHATREGTAVAFVHPYPVVLNKIKAWIAAAPDKGIQVAPLSAMVQR